MAITDKVTVTELMEDAICLFTERNLAYGESYRRFGPIMKALFPNGVTITTADDWNRMGVFFHIVDKLSRYSRDHKTGHIDSMKDIGVYSTILQQLDIEAELTAADNKE